jgi:hypothetical protein
VRERFAMRLGDPQGRGEVYEVAVRMEDGRPLIEHWCVHADPPLRLERLTEINEGEVVDAVMQQEAISQTPNLPYSREEIDPHHIEVVFDRLMSSSLAAARQARHRRNVTPELLRTVLALHEKGERERRGGGVELVKRDLGYSERNARRLLARARKELE